MSEALWKEFEEKTGGHLYETYEIPGWYEAWACWLEERAEKHEAALLASRARCEKLERAGKAVVCDYLKHLGYLPGCSILPESVIDFNAALDEQKEAGK